MDVTTERQDGVLSAQVGGRIDSANAVEFEEAIKTAIEESDRAVILDFEKLTYIGSAGLRAILLTAKTLENRNAKFALCSPVGSDPGGLRDERFRQDHRDPPVQGRSAHFPRRLTRSF